MTHDYSNLYFTTTGKNKLKVYYQPGTDGGGTWFGQEYLSVIENRYPGRVFDKCFEWCSGPGYIGYSILGHELAHKLCLADIYEPVTQQANRSRLDPYNRCANRVSVYHTGDISTIPEHEQFDLIVGNPPHFPNAAADAESHRLQSDVNWQTHQNFFAHIKSHLTADGVILLQENMSGSTVNTFRDMITRNDLKVTDWFKSPNWFKENDPCQIYYIEITHA